MLDILTLNDIAKDLRTSKRTIQRLATNGLLPVLRIQNGKRFSRVVPIYEYFEWKRAGTY